MTGESGMTDFDRLVSSWLANDGPQDVRPELVEAAIVGAASARQRRGLQGALLGSGAWPRRRSARWPFPGMTSRRLAILVVILLLAAAAGAMIVGAPNRIPAVIEPDGSVDHLVYSVDGDIFLADADGRNAVRIADGAPNGGFWSVSWSPDGRNLTFTGEDNVHVVDAAGKVVFSTPGCCAAWSPDGSLIATLFAFQGSSDRPDVNPGEVQVAFVGRDGVVRSERSWAGRGNFLGSGVSIYWTPDGRSITITGVQFGGAEAGGGAAAGPGWLIPVDGGSLTRLPITSLIGSASFFSPDGTKLVGQEETGRVVVAAADGSGARPLVPADRVPGVAGWYSALWSPDSTRIAATATTEQAETLYVIDVATGDVDAVWTYPQPAAGGIAFPLRAISWDGERDRLLFTAANRSASTNALWTIGVDGSEPQLLVDGAHEGEFQPLHHEQP